MALNSSEKVHRHNISHLKAESVQIMNMPVVELS